MQDNTDYQKNTDVDESTRVDYEKDEAVRSESGTKKATFGSGPSGPIADGGGDGIKQPKERTGKDSNMGGADGGTAGLGYSKEAIEPQSER